jgi:hypothetical protein
VPAASSTCRRAARNEPFADEMLYVLAIVHLDEG